MATDAESHWLVTGDTDGVVKVWDISEYCKHASEEIVSTPPRKYQLLGCKNKKSSYK